MKHILGKYDNGYRIVVFCRVCGEEVKNETDECSGQSLSSIKSLKEFSCFYDDDGNKILDITSEQY